MKKRILQIFFIAIFLILSMNCLSPPYAFADTDGSKISVIPDASFYVLGDNAEDSLDSRFWSDPCLRKPPRGG